MIELLKETKKLTPTEQIIAEYLLDFNHDITSLNSSSLARLSFTSQSAVTRLYKKLGFSSFRSFLSQLILEREQEQRYQYVTEDVIVDTGSLKDIEAVLSSVYSKTMLVTRKMNNENTINRVVNRILSCDSIDVYGVGISKTIADQLSYKLQVLGFNSRSFGGLNKQYVDTIKKDNVSILFTSSGENVLIKELTHYLKTKGIYTVVISGRSTSADAYYDFDCHEALYFDTSLFEDLNGITFMFGAEHVSNIIYASLSHRLTLANHLK